MSAPSLAGKVALVTGATRGLGLATVKLLIQRAVEVVYLSGKCAREVKNTARRLKDDGYNAHSLQLDVTDEDSVRRAAYHIQNEHSGLDYLVNNAGIMNHGYIYPNYWRAKRTIDVTYRGLLTMERFFFPLLKRKARVVNVSSACGHLSNINNEHWVKMLRCPDLTVAQINYFVDQYLLSVHNGSFRTTDFADEGKHAEQRVSKVAVTALTMIQAKKYARQGVIVNAVHPGNTKAGKDSRSPEEAAKLVVYMLLDAEPSLTGSFIWENNRPVDWRNHLTDLYYRHDDTIKHVPKVCGFI